MKMKRSYPSLAALCGFACLLSSGAQAASVLDTNFENATTANWSAYQTTNPANISLGQETDGSNTTNSYLNVTSGQSFRGIHHLLSSPVTLGQGDTVTVSFRFMFTNATSDVRFGLFAYSGGEQVITSDNGYYGRVTNGQTSVSINRDGDSANSPASGTTNTITPSSQTTVETAFAANVWYEASLSLTMLSNGMQVTSTVGNASATGTWTTGNFSTFGMLYIGSGNTNPRFAIDDVLVTSTSSIPEPSSAGILMGITAIGYLALRRPARGTLND
jgi:hypothetical protein